MNMHLWHRAAPNRSKQNRVGAFNKYAAASAPPATGYFLYDDDVYNALSDRGRSVIGVHSDRQILTTRSLLMRENAGGKEVLLCETDGRLCLPGGPTSTERAIPDWDLGNFIAPLQTHLRNQLAIELPWLSYIGDFPEADHLCRVYGYTLNSNGFPVPYKGRWVDPQTLSTEGFGYEAQALSRWLDPTIVRGKGLAQAQCRIDQFAY